jgi:hypothetical protein
MAELRMEQSFDEFEVALQQATDMDRRRRAQLRHRAATRSRARRIQSIDKRGNVGFGALLVALSLTVVIVTIVMFETLALLMG